MIYEHHSCGYITQIIPDLVEIGVDCINPLNICNDMEMIKREYGPTDNLQREALIIKIDAPGCPESEIRVRKPAQPWTSMHRRPVYPGVHLFQRRSEGYF